MGVFERNKLLVIKIFLGIAIIENRLSVVLVLVAPPKFVLCMAECTEALSKSHVLF